MKKISNAICGIIIKIASRRGLLLTISKVKICNINKIKFFDVCLRTKQNQSDNLMFDECIFTFSIFHSLFSFAICGKMDFANMNVKTTMISDTPFIVNSVRIECKIKRRKKRFYIEVENIPIYLRLVQEKEMLELYLKVINVGWNDYVRVFHNHIYSFIKKIYSPKSFSFHMYYKQKVNASPYFDVNIDVDDNFLSCNDFFLNDEYGHILIDEYFLKYLVQKKFTSLGKRQFIELSSISNFIINAVICTEDPDFWTHLGVSPLFVGYAIKENLKHQKFVRGASTITMQLVRNLFLTHNRNLFRKIEECIIALLLENYYRINKKTLLESYFNIVEFAPDIYGLHEACLFYFDKHPKELTLQEALVLTYIIPRPLHFYNALVEQTEQLKKNLSQHIVVYATIMYQKGLVEINELTYLSSEINFGKLGILVLHEETLQKLHRITFNDDDK